MFNPFSKLIVQKHSSFGATIFNILDEEYDVRVVNVSLGFAWSEDGTDTNSTLDPDSILARLTANEGWTNFCHQNVIR